LKISFWAIRFDLSALFVVNSIYILLLLLPHYKRQNSWWEHFSQIIFIISNTIAFFFEISDWGYFPYNHKRATADVLNMISRKGDFLLLLPRFCLDYWYLFLVALAFVLLFIKINKQIVKRTPLKADENVKIIPHLLRYFLVIGLGIVAVRGGFQLIPIGIRNAVTVSDSRYAPIVLNTPFSIITTYSNNEIEAEVYFDNQTLRQYINTTKQYNHSSFQKKNVVILILESFSKEFTGIGGLKSYTPFLDSLMQHSFVCTNAFANVLHSAEGIPAIIAGIPALQEEPFTTSVYGANPITSIPNVLSQKGYSSAFYHGGNNGTMSFDVFAANAGFQHYKGRNEYANDKDYDGNWGIWDEPFLQYAANDISRSLKPPFCTAIFTLSSHFPYNIPQQYKGQFPKGPLPIHETIAYTDFSIREFFRTASKQSWFNNTIFIIVPDHCAPISNNNYYSNCSGRYSIPIIYFSPNDAKLKGTSKLLTQQIDILPSLLDYLGYNDSFFAFGNSIFQNKTKRYTVQYNSGSVFWTMDNFLLVTLGKKPQSFFDLSVDSLCANNLLVSKDSMVSNSFQYVKAIKQAYSNALIKNAMRLK
jgi:phosphoglycerol transferase MdoB-like AlkP superfamily enzyme